MKDIETMHELKSDEESIESVEEKSLSLRVYELLENIGASEEMRRAHNENIIGDIIQGWAHSFGLGKKVSINTCGSWTEGTTIPALGSDVDKLLVRDYASIIVDLKDAGDGNSLLMIQDDHIQPGFYKLQLVSNRVPQTSADYPENKPGLKSDRNGKICFEHDILPGRDRHGPANTSDTGNNLMIDSVIAFKCVRIPDRDKEWMNHKRPYGWPSQEVIERMANQLSCFVVCVGSEGSTERDIEWRLSFSLQERELMLSLNPTQHKCYILMKLIKRDIIQPTLTEDNCLSSYHCKTCLFIVIENTPQEMWIPENLIMCLFRCLKQLFDYVSKGNCPNFFITGSNMFDRNSFRNCQTQLLHSLKDILNAGHKVLFRLKTDLFGELLKQTTTLDTDIQKRYRFILEITKINNPLFWSQLFLMLFQSDSNLNLYFLTEMVDTLENIVCVDNHTEKNTREAISFVIPWVYQRLAVTRASLVVGTQDEADQQESNVLSDIEEYFERGMATDLMNTHLIKIAVLFKFGKYRTCDEIIRFVEPNLQNHVINVCLCNLSREDEDNKELVTKITDNKMSTKDILYTAVCSCIRFLPSEKHFVPEPLKYEMYRSLFTKHGSRDERKQRWFDWAVLDANIFLCFMQYLVFSKLGLDEKVQNAVAGIKDAINVNGISLHHKETAYNLLGWIYQQELSHEEAAQCWIESLKLRPDHNAAKYHLLILLYNLYRYR